MASNNHTENRADLAELYQSLSRKCGSVKAETMLVKYFMAVAEKSSDENSKSLGDYKTANPEFHDLSLGPLESKLMERFKIFDKEMDETSIPIRSKEVNYLYALDLLGISKS